MSLIGTHVSIAGGFDKAILRGEELDCEAIQIFSKNQLQWKSSPPSTGRVASFQKCWTESAIQEVVVHGSYLVNPAASGMLMEKSLRALVEEVWRCHALGISTLVIHPGSHTDCELEEGITRVSVFLNKVLDQTDGSDVNIAIETMAGQGRSIGFRLEHLEQIISSLDWDDRITVCLDTAHLFASGYELRTVDSYERFVSRIERYFGSNRVACWHLNDTTKDKGSRIDRHEHIGEGELGFTIFEMILSDERWKDIPCILETPKKGPGDKANMAILRKLRGN